MWKLARHTSHGGKSVRSILTFALAVILTVFFATTTLSPSYAAPDTATWNGQSVSYDGKQFVDAGTSTAGDKSGIPAGNEYYEYTSSDTAKTAEIIYFTKDTDTTKTVDATYATYDIDKSTSPPSLTHPTSKQSITVDGGDKSGTTCAVATIGWIVCPVSSFIATGMDTIFGFLTQFVRVQPVDINSTNNPLFTGWNMMRGIANVAFIIAFILIIYSQITSVGITNYSLKKLLPRLILSALLVNLSYYIAAVAVDISNIVGTSIQDFFSNVSQTVFHAPGQGKNVITWSSMTAFVLSGGTAAVAGGIALLAATGGTVGGLVFLLLPVLLGLLLTILVVLLVLAARQALIVILIIIAPIAFVAYLLPNTEKWFNRWRETFMAMLIFFPAFSAVYAGAQLAGQIIIVNASSLVMLVLGMAVQLAPLVITPWLLKLSTGVLGRVAGMIHGSTKSSRSGLQSWANKNREYHRQRGFSYNPRNEDGTMKKSRFARSRYWAASVNNMDRDLDEKTNNVKAEADNVYHQRKRYEDLHEQSYWAQQDKTAIEESHNAHLAEKIAGSPDLYQRQLQTTIATDRNARAKEALETALKEAKSGNIPRQFKTGDADTDEQFKTTAGITELVQINQQLAAQKSRSAMADAAINQMVAKAFSVAEVPVAQPGEAGYEAYQQYLQSQELLTTAGGVMGKVGERRAHANAVATLRNAKLDAIKSVIAASDVKAGHVDDMVGEIQKAIGDGTTQNPVDIVSIRAYIDMLANSSNPGISKLRDTLSVNIEGAARSGILNADQLQEIKDHINNNGIIQGAAEDIGTWGRSEKALAEIGADVSTWSDLSTAAFAGQKKSSQNIAIDTGAISSKSAREILSSEEGKKIKRSVQSRLEQIASLFPDGDAQENSPLDPRVARTIQPPQSILDQEGDEGTGPDDTSAASPGHPEPGPPMPDA